jgi:hypothetical protein
VDTDHIGRVARGQSGVQDPVSRVRRHDDQASIVRWLRHDADAGCGDLAGQLVQQVVLPPDQRDLGGNWSQLVVRSGALPPVVIEPASALAAEQPGIAQLAQ